MTLIHTEQLTIDEFVRLYEQEGPFEIINGERVKLMPPLALHVIMIGRLMDLFKEYEKAFQNGRFFSEAPFVLTYDSNWVQGSRTPDILFYRANRLAKYLAEVSDWEDKPFILVPDLVVEVVSKNDTYTEIDEKVAGYLRDGVKLVWVVDPRRKVVVTHQANQQLRLMDQDVLTGGEVLPAFEIIVEKIFG